MEAVISWMLFLTGRLHIVLAPLLFLLNTVLIHAAYGSSTSYPTYFLLHLYNSNTPIRMWHYGQACCNLAKQTSQQPRVEPLSVFFRSILWLLANGIWICFLIAVGEVGNESSGYRLIMDTRRWDRLFCNMWCNPWGGGDSGKRQDLPEWVSAIQEVMYTAYGVSAIWLMLLPLGPIALIAVKITMILRKNDRDLTVFSCGKGIFGTSWTGVILRELVNFLLVVIVSYLLYWMPFKLSFTISVICALFEMGMMYLMLSAASVEPAKAKPMNSAY